MGSDEAAASITKIIYQVPSGESASLCDDQDWAAALQATNFKPVLTVIPSARPTARMQFGKHAARGLVYARLEPKAKHSELFQEHISLLLGEVL
ncbi:hypothetical protein H4S00_005686 [Coemansia sp. D1744]|nr:hypothetical protein H4S00_005686 [Coemansia sp. D1744]